MSEKRLREFQDQIDLIYENIMADESYLTDPGGHLAGAVGNLDRAVGSLEEAIERINKELCND